MASTVFDSAIFKDVFGTPDMRAVFSDENLLRSYVAAEVALAQAQGRVGVIPQAAADAIAANASTDGLDLGLLKRDAENVGYPILGLVRQLAERLGEPGRYLHWGATTQDIMDTAVVLQVREALELVERDIAAVSQALASLARALPRHPDAGPHPSPAGASHHLRLQGGGLALR